MGRGRRKKIMLIKGIGGGGGGGLLLDDYPSANIAFSLRLLRTAYGGNCIKVRRTSDSTTQNIGFSSGVLDISSLETFCSGTDGYVERWYDQSGNGIDAIQTTTALQPKIVTSGTTITDGGLPATYWDGTNGMPVAHTLTAPFGFLAAAHPNDPDAGTGFTLIGNKFWSSMATGLWNIAHEGAAIKYRRVTTNQAFHTWTNDTSNISVIDADSSGNATVDVGGTSGTPGTALETSTATATSHLGGVTLRYWIGHMQEVVIWHSDQGSNVTGISDNANTFYGYY